MMNSSLVAVLIALCSFRTIVADTDEAGSYFGGSSGGYSKPIHSSSSGVGYGYKPTGNYGYRAPVKQVAPSKKKKCCQIKSKIDAEATCYRVFGDTRDEGDFTGCHITIDDDDDDCFPYEKADLKSYQYELEGATIYTIQFTNDHGVIQAIGTGGKAADEAFGSNDSIILGIVGGFNKDKYENDLCGELEIEITNFERTKPVRKLQDANSTAADVVVTDVDPDVVLTGKPSDIVEYTWDLEIVSGKICSEV